MIEADIHTLNERPSRSLDALEADIWAGVAARIAAKRTSNLVLACQGLVLAIALFGSVATGTRMAVVNDVSQAGLGVFSTRADLAPSTRLIRN